MNLKINEIVLGALLVISPIIGSAQVNDGVYAGTMKCGSLLTNPIQGPWSQSIHVTVNADNVTWERSSPTFSESGKSSIQSGRVSLNANGAWNPGGKNTGSWKTVALLNLEGEKLAGLATIFSENGVQRLRDCTVSVSVTSQSSSVSQTHRSQTPSNNTTSSLDESRVEKTIKQMVVQATNKPQQSAVVSINQIATKAASKVQQVVPTMATNNTDAPSSSSTIGGSKGKLFSTKAEFIQKTRDGQFKIFSHTNSEEKEAFAESIRAILRNDYGVTAWPTDRVMKNGMPVVVLARGCAGEFEYYLEKIFFQTVWDHDKNMPRDPTNLTDSIVYRLPKNAYEFAGQERKISRESIDRALVQLQNLHNGLCAKDAVHPYQIALPKLFTEFDRATADIFSNKLTSIRASYQEKYERENARLIAIEVANKERAEIAAVNNRKNEEQKFRLIEDSQASKDSAPERQAQKIKTLGFPSSFLNSSININFPGLGNGLEPTRRWIAIVLDNKKTTSLEYISDSGNPGVYIRYSDGPPVKMLFKVEGKVAHIYLINVMGQDIISRTVEDKNTASLFLYSLINRN